MEQARFLYKIYLVFRWALERTAMDQWFVWVVAATKRARRLVWEQHLVWIGIDTPEKAPRAKCLEEAALAQRASLHTKRLVANAKNIEMDIKGWDKYGGRILGTVRIDGVDLSESLISNGFARAYFGEKKQSWCNWL